LASILSEFAFGWQQSDTMTESIGAQSLSQFRLGHLGFCFAIFDVSFALNGLLPAKCFPNSLTMGREVGLA
jgi:hypothetical protein